MVKRTRGLKSSTRHLLKKKPRTRGRAPITKALQTFEIGEKAHIVIEPSVHKGQPHRRFHGHTGTVVETRGNSYLLDVRIGNAIKQTIARPEHLNKVKE